MKEFDFSSPFIRKLAEGYQLPIDDDNIQLEHLLLLEGVLSMCVLSYYFGKMCTLFIKDALEKKNNCQFSDEQVRNVIEKIMEKRENNQNLSFSENLIMDVELSETNKAVFDNCVEQIKIEYLQNEVPLMFVTNDNLGNDIEKEIMRRNSDTNYLNFYNNLNEALDYYALQDQGIEDYLFSASETTEKGKLPKVNHK